MRIIAILLILGGILALVFGGFSYTEDKTVAKIGSIELNAKRTHTVDLPVWAGVAAVVVGGLLLVMGRRR
jgi:TRAP-type C4-dicarboxylate transport system permease small subunit